MTITDLSALRDRLRSEMDHPLPVTVTKPEMFRLLAAVDRLERLERALDWYDTSFRMLEYHEGLRDGIKGVRDRIAEIMEGGK